MAATALVRDWRRRVGEDPDPSAVAQFYRETDGLADDLAEFHSDATRQGWTKTVCAVARQEQSKRILDVGCGYGHDLRALRALDLDATLTGIEPNNAAAANLLADGFTVYPSLDSCTGQYDLVLCIDVLEHIPNPQTFVAEILDRIPVGGFLLEATATDDVANPTHLKSNWGWLPNGQILGAGFELVEQDGRLHIWKRVAEKGGRTKSLLLCAYRNVQVETMRAVAHLVRRGWGLRIHSGDALISRSRSIAVSTWLRETNDDCFLMIDDDITFNPGEADAMLALCREVRGVVAGAYVVRNGQHFASRFSSTDTSKVIGFGPEAKPEPAEYVATGFLAVHRDVIVALKEQLPLVHPHMDCGWWPFFDTSIVEHPQGFSELLSEDWHFSKMVREAGFPVLIDPRVRLGHIGQKEYTIHDLPDSQRASGPIQKDTGDAA